ncbi:MAG: HAD family hydrolase [Spirochaetaceae bacterium]|nr:HAD family hydrolase [Spirochaetaceae bacterium]
MRGVLHRSRASRFAAAIFDLDGTLVDSLPDLAAAMNATLRALGEPVHPLPFYLPLIGGGVEVMVAGAIDPNRRSERLVATAGAMMRAHYRRNALRTTRPYPGVRALLADLTRRRVPMAVLSNKLHPETVHVVRGAFPGVPFRAILGLQPPRPAKPDPAGILELCRALRVAPRRVLVVGDGDTDMLAARRAGAWPAGATWGYRSPRALLAAGAARLAPHPSAVRAYLAS